jgi:hypothetical protein
MKAFQPGARRAVSIGHGSLIRQERSPTDFPEKRIQQIAQSTAGMEVESTAPPFNPDLGNNYF